MKYVPLFILALSQVILNVVLTYKRHDKISRVFTYFTLLLLGWTFINITLDYGLSHDLLGLDLEGKLVLVNALNRAGFLFGSILLVVIYHAVIVSQEVTDSEEARPIIWVGLWLAAASLLPIFSGEYYAANGMFAYHYGVASILYLPYTVALGWRIVKIATQKLRTDQTRLERKQTLTVLAAMFLSAVWGLIFIIILPLITQNDEYIFVGYLAPYIFTALMYYAIIWLGLLNFRQVIARSIGYLLSLAALGAVFILSLQLIVRFILRDNIATQEALLFAMVSFGSAAMFQPAKRFFDKLTNEIFYRDAYDSERVFNKLSRTLVSAYDLNDLLSAVAKLLAEELKVSFVAVQLKQHEVIGWPDEKIRQDVVTIERAYKIFSEVVSDDEDIVVTELLRNNDSPQLRSILRDSDLSVIMRVTSMGKRPKRELGYIVIGQKRSGNMFTKQDILVIQAVANEIQLAIQNALHFEEIQQFNATLQEKVEEQTRKYRMANEKLKKLDETKDEFISMASHQLRTPLTSVKGYLSMVLEGDAGKLNKQQEELLKQSFMSSQRMVNLIADLLNLSRLNTGKFVIDAQPTDLRVIVDQEVAQLRESAKAKGITLRWQMPPTFSMLNLDEGKIHQVVMNFIDNALYYTPEGGDIEVSLTETPRSIEYRVKDTGIGVPREIQRHLFSKFYRADNARRMRPDGTGLGIYMAKKVIAAQGGSVIFESEEGKGSTFGFRFSKTRANRLDSEQPQQA